MTAEDFEARRLALEETKEANAFALRTRELEIAAQKAEADLQTAGGEQRGKLNLAAVSVVSAIVGAVASLGAAAVSGMFSVQEVAIEQDAAAQLETQKFSFELIQSALTAPDQEEQIRRLQFFANIGLLPTVDVAALKAIADDAERYIESGGTDGRALPNYGTQTRREKINAVRAALERKGICLPEEKENGNLHSQLLLDCVTEILPGGHLGHAAHLVDNATDRLLRWIDVGKVPADWKMRMPGLAEMDPQDGPWKLGLLFALMFETTIDGNAFANAETADPGRLVAPLQEAPEPVPAPSGPQPLDLSPRPPLLPED